MRLLLLRSYILPPNFGKITKSVLLILFIYFGLKDISIICPLDFSVSFKTTCFI